MIRQAHSYLAGAVSGAALIAAAVIVFILLLVSTQGFRDLPIVDIGGDESASVAPARPAAPGRLTGTTSTTDPGDSDRSVGAGQGGLATGGDQGGATSPASSSPSAGGGGASPSPGSAPTPSSGIGSGSGSNSSGGGGGSAGNGGDSVSGTVAGAVDDTVNGVGGALGGALGRTGVTDATQGVVDGVAGPDSVVGQTVDGTAGAVRDLLGAGR